MKNTKIHHPRYQHSLAFYKSVLDALIYGLNQGLSDRDIAARLNSLGIRSATGKPWTSVSVKAALFKIRHHKEVASRLHQALLQLAFDGVLKASDTFVLFQQRRVINAD